MLVDLLTRRYAIFFFFFGYRSRYSHPVFSLTNVCDCEFLSRNEAAHVLPSSVSEAGSLAPRLTRSRGLSGARAQLERTNGKRID